MSRLIDSGIHIVTFFGSTPNGNLSGSYCFERGLASPTGLCDEGYYCSAGAIVAAPDSSSALGYTGDTCVDRTNGTINDVCPPGHYCPAGERNKRNKRIVNNLCMLHMKCHNDVSGQAQLRLSHDDEGRGGGRGGFVRTVSLEQAPATLQSCWRDAENDGGIW